MQAFDFLFSENDQNLLRNERIENLKWLLGFVRDDTDLMDKQSFILLLENLVNVTDFIHLSELLSIFEADTLEFCFEKLRSESSTIGDLHS